MLKHIISLGAGVQSSTMALMAAKGQISPMPDAAIFADTGWEPATVYKWLQFLEQELPFPVYRVQHKQGLKNSQWQKNVAFRGKTKNKTVPIHVPVFTQHRKTHKIGIVQRQCTSDYKILPVVKKTKELIGLQKGKRLPKEPQVVTWIGISKDEIVRMKPSRYKFIQHRFPLIEQNFTRLHCLEWMKKYNFPEPPRSSCIICPFHSDKEWQNLSQQEFAEACEFDEFIREKGGMEGTLHLHRSGTPLRTVDLADPHENQLNLFNNECEGMCGV